MPFFNHFNSVPNTKNVFQNRLMRNTEDFPTHFLSGHSCSTHSFKYSAKVEMS